MTRARFRTAIALATLVVRTASVHAAEPIMVKPGESVQAAIDRAPDGATIALAAGVYDESVVIAKPLTLRGAGMDKTTLGPDKPTGITQKQKDDFFAALERTNDQDARVRLAVAFVTRRSSPTITVTNATGVTISGLRVRGPSPGDVGGSLGPDTLVQIDRAAATVADCAIVGPFMNGVTTANDSNLTIKKCLIAALWGTGVAAGPGTTLRLVDSDVRNCFHRCVTIATNDATVERCRISGSAWHGVRYDNCSPKILANHIFANARSGIYASGRTAAVVRGNVFYRNEMDAMSCWMDNRDTIENNTIVGSLREGISVIGGARPTLTRNVFVDNPIAVTCAKLAGRGQAEADAPVGTPTLTANVFFNNAKPMQEATADKPLPPGNTTADPKLGGAANDFKLSADSPVRTANAGAPDPIPFASPFAVRPEETAMVPGGETRDSTQWKKIATAR